MYNEPRANIGERTKRPVQNNKKKNLTGCRQYYYHYPICEIMFAMLNGARNSGTLSQPKRKGILNLRNRLYARKWNSDHFNDPRCSFTTQRFTLLNFRL